jgi:tRNA-2-methylthio-N6-dimethylallyladenosine synthase
VGFPGETDADFADTLSLLDEVGYDSIFSFQYSPRPNTSALRLENTVPDEEKGRRLRLLQQRQREIQLRRNAALVGTQQEVLVEGRNRRGHHSPNQQSCDDQWKGRTSQNMVLNFTVPAGLDGSVAAGQYRNVRVSKAGPNSLVGEAV